MLSNFSSKQEDKSRFVLGQKMCKYIQGVQHNGLIYIYCEMITTIGSTNIHLLLQTQYVEEKGEKIKEKYSPCDEDSDLLTTTFLCVIQQC